MAYAIEQMMDNKKFNAKLHVSIEKEEQSYICYFY